MTMNFFSKHKSPLLFLLRVIIAFLFIYYLIRYVNYTEIIVAVQKANPYWLAAGVLFGVFNIYLQYVRWKILCTSVLDEHSPGRIWLSLFYGLSGGIATPLKSGEYLGRAIPFNKAGVIDTSLATLVEKLFSILLAYVIGGGAFLLFTASKLNLPGTYTALIFIAYFSLLIAAVTAYLTRDKLKQAVKNKLSDKSFFSKLVSAYEYIKKFKRVILIKVGLVSFLFYAVFTLQYAFFIAAFEVNTNLIIFLWVSNLVIFTQTVIPQISFGELGIREGSAVFFLGVLGYSEAAGFSASLLLFLVNILLPAIIGLVLLAVKPK